MGWMGKGSVNQSHFLYLFYLSIDSPLYLIIYLYIYLPIYHFIYLFIQSVALALHGMDGHSISQPVAALFGCKRQNCRHRQTSRDTSNGSCNGGDHHHWPTNTNTKTHRDTNTYTKIHQAACKDGNRHQWPTNTNTNKHTDTNKSTDTNTYTKIH